jgi:hypothetical protein
MKKWMLVAALAVAGFVADTASAQEAIAQPQQQVMMAQPVQQRGLFGRLRARRGEPMMVYQPMTTTQQQTAAKPMPNPSGVEQAQFTRPGTTPNAQAQQGTTDQPMVMQPQNAQPRMGILARFRARRGY